MNKPFVRNVLAMALWLLFLLSLFLPSCSDPRPPDRSQEETAEPSAASVIRSERATVSSSGPGRYVASMPEASMPEGPVGAELAASISVLCRLGPGDGVPAVLASSSPPRSVAVRLTSAEWDPDTRSMVFRLSLTGTDYVDPVLSGVELTVGPCH